MKKMALILLASIAAPAWAEDAPAPASATQAAVTVQLSGSAKGVQALLAKLENDAVYKDSGCSGKPMKKSAKTAKISCTNAGGALLAYLGQNTPDKVRWNVSGAVATKMSATQQPLAPRYVCPVGCTPTICGGVTGCFRRGCLAC
jgi:hypothetical protein